MKPEIKEAMPSVYQELFDKDTRLRKKPYGLTWRTDMNLARQVMRHPDAELSIFDNDAFNFYLLKYADTYGVDMLVIASSTDRNMSYEQKTRLISQIVETERGLGIDKSSWKHCLMFMLMNGSISEE